MTLSIDADRPDLPWKVTALRGIVYHFALESQARRFMAGTWPL